MRILLIQKNRSLASSLISALEQRRFVIEWTNDGTLALRILDIEEFDAVILDIDVPGKNGYDILYHLKTSGNRVPVLVVTERTSLADRIMSLNEGADDFLSAPVETAELEARLYAISRRYHKIGYSAINCGPLVFDTQTRNFRYEERVLNLPPREHALLLALIQRVGRTVPKQALFDRVFGHTDVNLEAVEVTICRLRKQLVNSPVRIVNMRGLGYRLEYCDQAARQAPCAAMPVEISNQG
jgi:two-component system, OmpR family, response regulator TctD